MTGSWVFSHYTGGGYTVDWAAQAQEQYEAANKALNGLPYAAVLKGMYCPSGICGNFTETSQTVTWTYQIVDYRGQPVSGLSGLMWENLVPLYEYNDSDPTPSFWVQEGSLFTDYIGGTGNFSPDSSAVYIGLQTFSVVQENVQYNLNTTVMQVWVVQNGRTTVAEPIVVPQ